MTNLLHLNIDQKGSWYTVTIAHSSCLFCLVFVSERYWLTELVWLMEKLSGIENK